MAFEEDLRFITTNYPSIATVQKFGLTTLGRPMYIIKLSKESDVDKPCIFLLSNIHAREDFSLMLTMKSIDALLYEYYTDGKWDHYDINYILDHLDLYIVPLANPDGFYISRGMQKTNLKITSGELQWIKSNANGVDLNSNFDDGNWYSKKNSEKSKTPATEGYFGTSPSSERETKALINIASRLSPLAAVSFHTSGETMFWSDNITSKKLNGLDVVLSDALSKITGYKKEPMDTNPAVYSSGFENWFRYNFNRVAICLELSPMSGVEFAQLEDSKFDSTVWTRAKYVVPEFATQVIDNIVVAWDGATQTVGIDTTLVYTE